jgi:hypothetical protein
MSANFWQRYLQQRIQKLVAQQGYNIFHWENVPLFGFAF